MYVVRGGGYMSYEEEDTCVSYDEEDCAYHTRRWTCEGEDTYHMMRSIHAWHRKRDRPHPYFCRPYGVSRSNVLLRVMRWSAFLRLGAPSVESSVNGELIQ